MSRESSLRAPSFRSGRVDNFAEVHSDGYTRVCMDVKLEDTCLVLKNCLSLAFVLTRAATQLATVNLDVLEFGLVPCFALGVDDGKPYLTTSAKEPERA